MNPPKTDNQSNDSKAKGGAVGFGIVLRGIRRHPFILCMFVLLSCSAAATVWLYLPLPKLTAYSTLQIKAQPDAIFRPEGDAKIDFNMYRQSQTAIIKSRVVLNLALNQSDIGRYIPDADKISWLDKELKVDFKIGPELMRVSMESNNAEGSLAIITAVTNSYLKDVVNKDRAKRLARLEQLTKIHEKWSAHVESQRQQLSIYAEKIGTGDAAAIAAQEKYRQEMIGIWQHELINQNRDILVTETEMKTQEGQVNKSAQLLDVPEKVVTTSLELDPVYQKLLEKKRLNQLKLDATKNNLAPGITLPIVTEKEKEIADNQTEIEQYVVKMRPLIIEKIRENALKQDNLQLDTLKRKVESLRNLAASLNEQVNKLETKDKDFKKDQFEFQNLKSVLLQLESRTNSIYQEMESIKPELDSSPRVSIWEEPLVVLGIEGSRRLKYTAIAFLPGLLLGLGLVTTLEFRNRRVLGSAEVSATLGLRVIGTVPALCNKSIRKGSPISTEALALQQHVAESIDHTRTLLLHGLEGTQSVRTIMITSALSGEGKSSLAGHLSVSLARAGFRTVLVDGDMRRPCLHRVMGVPLQLGLSELLRGAANLDAVIHPSPVDNLSIIPAGLWDPSLPRVLAGKTWAELKLQLESEFDYIIVDTSPILAVADTLLMARHVDGVLISLLHNVSQMGAVSVAKERLTTVGTNILGVVINGIDNDYYARTYSYSPRTLVGDPSYS